MMRITSFLAIVGLACSLPASAQTETSEDVKRAAIDAHHACLRNKANSLDDGVSSAEVIAKAIAPLCDDELQAAVSTFAPFRSKRSENMLREMRREGAIETATVIVLQERKKGKSQ